MGLRSSPALRRLCCCVSLFFLCPSLLLSACVPDSSLCRSAFSILSGFRPSVAWLPPSPLLSTCPCPFPRGQFAFFHRARGQNDGFTVSSSPPWPDGRSHWPTTAVEAKSCGRETGLRGQGSGEQDPKMTTSESVGAVLSEESWHHLSLIR